MWLKCGNGQALRWSHSCTFGCWGQGSTHFWLSRIKVKWNIQFCCCCWWISSTLSGLCTFSVRCGLLKWTRGRFPPSLSFGLLFTAVDSESAAPAWTKKSIWQTTFTAGPTEIHASASCCCCSIIFGQSRAPDTSHDTLLMLCCCSDAAEAS